MSPRAETQRALLGARGRRRVGHQAERSARRPKARPCSAPPRLGTLRHGGRRAVDVGDLVGEPLAQGMIDHLEDRARVAKAHLGLHRMNVDVDILGAQLEEKATAG